MRIDFNKDWNYDGASVTLPHDAMLHGTRSAGAATASGGGYFESGEYVYEKTFFVPNEWEGKLLTLEFEGVYRNAVVYVNGAPAGGRPYGYIPFFVQISDFVRYGEENTIKVVADNSEAPNSRWYSGGGIYRPVWLHVKPKSHIDTEGVRVTTRGTCPPKVHVDVAYASSESAAIKIEILDGDRVVACGNGDSVTFILKGARLWSDEDPYLYSCRVTLTDGEDVDTETVSFGIRLIHWSPSGLFVNGHITLLRGGCLHHDNGVLGACSYAEAEERRVRTLKEGGFNAIRSAHNPCSKAMLEACDKLGVYLMDESWDTWYYKKNPYDYGRDFLDHYKEDISSIVSRDYNHPSVILYSIGNEVSEPCNDEGVKMAGELVNLFHEADSTRPVTAGINLMILAGAASGKGLYDQDKMNNPDAAEKEKKQPTMNSTVFNAIASKVGSHMNKAAVSKKVDAVTSPVLDLLDIAGYNYASGRYPLEAKEHPDRVVVGSETFPQDLAKNWEMVKKYPYLIGDFMWTAWDYLGETGIGAWSYEEDAGGFSKPFPWLLADTGAFDILGNPTGEAFWAKAVWKKDTRPMIAVHPFGPRGASLKKSVWRGSDGIESWGWTGHEGELTTVEVFTSAYKVGLLLNGRLVGLKKTKDSRAVFTVKYQPGVLKAVALDKRDDIVSRTKIYSADDAEAGLYPEKNTVRPGELLFVPIRIADKDGNLESALDQQLWLNVTGGTLLGMGSACPRTTDRYDTGCCRSWHGSALAVIRAGESGEIHMELKTIHNKTELSVPIEE